MRIRPVRTAAGTAAIASTATLAMAWSVVTCTPVKCPVAKGGQHYQQERAKADKHPSRSHDRAPALQGLGNFDLVVVQLCAVAERLGFPERRYSQQPPQFAVFARSEQAVGTEEDDEQQQG